MASVLKSVAERARYLPALFGSCASFLGAAAAAAAATPDHQVGDGLAVLVPGVGAALLNEFHKSFHDSSDEEKARRNHLIRRGMAQALRDALLHAETEFAEDVPADLRDSFFKEWPQLLTRAQTDDDLIDMLFPLDQSEDQWNLLNRYYDDLNAAKGEPVPTAQRTILLKREAEDQQALASLLRHLPLREEDSPVTRLFGQNLADRWPDHNSLAFAAKLLPLYRISFAATFSQGGPISDAIAYKSQKFTREQLESIEIRLQDGFESLGKQMEGVSGQVSGLDSKVEALTEMVARLLDQQSRSGGLPSDAVTPGNKQANIEETVREIPKVIEEFKQSNSPVATANVEALLAEGKLDEAAKVGQAQFDAAQKAYAEQGRNFAQASYDMGRINEISFRWSAALENYRQAWELSRDPDYGYQYAFFAAKLNHHQEAIAAYEAVLDLKSDSPDRAAILNNLAILYRATQRMSQAETAYSEALAIRRKLAEANPDAYLPYVAMTLNNLGLLYRATQRMSQAETAYSEALAIYRKLADANPDAYLPDVAMTLNNLANLLSATQRLSQAETAYSEALAIRRKLAEANPDAYLPDVAQTLNNLGLLYSAIQRMSQAETAYSEALATYRKLADANPDAYLPYVAMTLNNLANLYRDTQRMSQAETAYSEALAIYRKLAEANPDAYLPYVAGTLNNLAILYRATQRMTRAETAYSEALAIYRKLAEANPDAYLPFVAMTLNNLAILYRATQRISQAETAYSEALAIRRKLAEANPDAYLPDVANTLNNLAILFSDTQRMSQAETACSEALAIYRKLAEANPDAYLPSVAMTLNNLANLFSDTQRMSQAETAYSEALAIRRKLADANPGAYLPDVAMTLNNLAFLQFSEGSVEAAEASASEAIEILEPLWQANPELHGNLMARILWTRALIEEAAGKTAEACALARRGLAAAYDPTIKESIQELIDGLCDQLKPDQPPAQHP
jgi:tetratricopeptide (TPR) repeat protein